MHGRVVNLWDGTGETASRRNGETENRGKRRIGGIQVSAQTRRLSDSPFRRFFDSPFRSLGINADLDRRAVRLLQTCRIADREGHREVPGLAELALDDLALGVDLDAVTG